jgi:photosystem II stability/assembly factor-like uncharacterized protein
MTQPPETHERDPEVSGKTFLRQEEFRRQRGLRSEPKPLEDALEAAESPYLLATEEKEEMLGAAPPAPAWRPLGPAGIPHGQTYGSGPGSNPTVAGRIGAIAVDPSDSAHLLVGSAAGGIWETRDTGATWTPRTDDQPTLSIGALAFDPNDSTKVYAGTGEGNSFYSDLGQGVLRSSDGGTTWTILAREVFPDIGFYSLVVDPRDGNRLFAATTGGAVVSTDAGESWALLRRGLTWDLSLAYRGDQPELFLAAPDGLFAVGDSSPARVALPGLPPTVDPNMERIAVAHVPTDPGQVFVFAASGGRQGPPGGEPWEMGVPQLWHRSAAGEPFAPVRLPSLPVGPERNEALRVDQASYDWYLAVPPRSDDVVYLGAIELVKGERHHADWSWSDISSREGDGDSIHPDQHTMAFDPQDPDVIYAGNDGGIFRSPDGGVSWESLNAGLDICEVEYLTQRRDEPTWILAGLQDNGTVRREAEGEWAQVGLGDGGDCATDTNEPDICFRSYIYMVLKRSTSKGEPGSWKDITPTRPNETRSLFYPPVESNAGLLAKAGDVVCLSADRGESWAKVPLPPTPEGKASVASALALPSPDRVVAGTIRGDVFQIDAAGGGWGGARKLTTPAKGWISDLLIDGDTPSRYWATFTDPRGVFRSDDEGATWTEVTAGLPAKIPVNAIVTDPADRERVWVACDVGVFESRDAGDSWSIFGTELPNALTEDLTFYEPDRLLRVGTRSRGVWEIRV